jgi:hypothetical protein
MDRLYCGTHNLWLPRSSFYEGSVRAGESRCKQCNGAARLLRRQQDPVLWLQWKLYQYERKRNAAAPYPERAFVECILRQFGGRSALSHASSNLCIVRYFPDLPLSVYPWNAVLVTAPEARALPRRLLALRQSAFPASIQETMHYHATSQAGA